MGFPSGYNTFVPSLEASGSLVVNFSRAPSTFSINKYVGIKKVDFDTGKYLYISPTTAARVGDPNKFKWVDNADAPTNYLLEDFNFRNYSNNRYAFAFQAGNRAIEQAAWDLVASYAEIAAQAAMNARTLVVQDVLTDTANWGTHTAAASSIGGKWDAGTTADPNILQCLNYAAQQINLGTGGIINGQAELQLVVNPNTAQAMNASAEIQDYLKGSYDARARILGDAAFTPWGPSSIYGYNVVVENAVIDDSNIGSSANPSYALPDGYALLLARPNVLVNSESTYNTCTLFMSEEMTVETKLDNDNRRTVGRVVENYSAVITAEASGFLFTAVTW